jgi:hypothetical protein
VRFGIFRTLASMGRLLDTLGIAPPGEATRPAPRSVFHTVQDDVMPRRDDFIHTWRTPALGPRGDQPAPPPAASEPPAATPTTAPGQPAQPGQPPRQ